MLELPPCFEGCVTTGHVRTDSGHALLYRRIMNLRRCVARGTGSRRSGKRILYRPATFAERAAERGEFTDLLYSESEPGLEIHIEFALQVEIDGNMQQRTGGREHHLVRSSLLHDGLDAVEQGIEIGPPYVAAVDHTQRKDEIRRRLGEHVFELRGRAHQIELQARDGQAERRIEIVANRPEIS